MRGVLGNAWDVWGLAGRLFAQATEVASAGRGEEWRLESQWPLESGWLWGLGIALFTWISVLAWYRQPLGSWWGKARGTLAGRSGARALEGGGSNRGELPGEQHSLRQRWVIWALRTAAAGLLLWMLGGWQITRFETDLPDLVVLIDTSQSMQLDAERGAAVGAEPEASQSVGTGEIASRWERVVQLLGAEDGALLERLSEQYRLRLQTVGSETERVPGEVGETLRWLEEAEPSGETSRLGEQLIAAARRQRGRSTAALLMLTDGVSTQGPDLAVAGQQIASQRIPLFVARAGNTRPAPQVSISELFAESTAMVGDMVSVMVRLRWTARGEQPIVTRLIDMETEEVLAEEVISGAELGGDTVGMGDGNQVLRLAFLAREAGTRRFQVRVEPLRGELAIEDNTGQVTVDVRSDSFRVLLIQGGPSYEFRFLKHLLERATNQDGTRPLVELISVLQQGDPRYAGQDRAARALPPVDSETLEALDMVILSDCDPAALGGVLQEKLVELVSQGGVSLVVLVGPDYLPGALAETPLAKLLPVDPERVRVPTSAAVPLGWRLTPLGESVPHLQLAASQDDAWETAAPFYWLMRAERLRPGARVLLESAEVPGGGGPEGGTARPIVVSQLVGNGQVWMHLTDEFFRLDSEPLRSEIYERYWLQLVRSLARRRDRGGEGDATLEVQGERFREGAAVPFRVRLGNVLKAAAEGSVEVTVTDGLGGEWVFSGTPDLRGEMFQGVIEGIPPGVYRAVLTRPAGQAEPATDTFVVQPQAGEMRDSVVDAELLERAVAPTGGAVVPVSAGGEAILELLPPGRAIRLRPLPPSPVWNHWGIATILMGLLCGEWVLRRWWGGV